MPTSADLLLDTSAAIPFCLPSQDLHSTVIDRTRGLVLGLAGHAAMETFSVLTRLPGRQRLGPGAARRVIVHNFPATHQLGARPAARALDEFADAGVAGGAVYDALVGLTAREAGKTLLTADRRALPTYSRLDVRVELLSP